MIQIHQLLLVVFPEANSLPVDSMDASEVVLVPPPISAAFRHEKFQQLATELKLIKAAMKSDKDKHRAELEALQTANIDLQAQVSDIFISYQARKAEDSRTLRCEPCGYPLDHLACRMLRCVLGNARPLV